MKYIDAEKLIAEIERRREKCADIAADERNEEVAEYYRGKEVAYDETSSLIASLQREKPEHMIQWTGNNLKEVIDFTGKSPMFEEWFKSWEEFESYVHSHGDILKLFSEDGSHYEVPVGAWIVKTPDGYNVPSVAKYIQQEQPEVEFEVKFAEFLERKDAELGAKSWSEDDLRELALYFYYGRNNDKQPEVDLEREIRDYFSKWSFDYYNSVITMNNDIVATLSSIQNVARHFYELGASVMRKRITNPEYNQKIIEKMKSEYPADELNTRKV